MKGKAKSGLVSSVGGCVCVCVCGSTLSFKDFILTAIIHGKKEKALRPTFLKEKSEISFACFNTSVEWSNIVVLLDLTSVRIIFLRSSLLWGVLVCSFLLLRSILLHGYVTSCLSISF